MPKVKKIETAVPQMAAKKKVAAYARISMETERMNHSLSAQISYYNALVQKNPEWEYAGVYSDNGISGTGIAKRKGFKEMIKAAENGEIDIILTKSIQRFARNTVDLLETVRHLKDIGVEVRFEKENISSMSGDGELMLTILASFAQEESRSISENVKWGIRKRMEQGIPYSRPRMLGYRWEGDQLVVVPEEAEIVKRIFQNFLDGKSRLETEREFEAEGITSINGCIMRDSNIRAILTNITYTGNMLLQKSFIADPIEKKIKWNHGELPQYFVENTHEAIIDMETFKYVQEEMARRKKLGALANKSLNTSCFTGKIKCPYCGCSYMRNFRNPATSYAKLRVFWTCGTQKKGQGGHCPIGGTILQNKLVDACTSVLGLDEFDENIFLERVDTILVPKRHQLEFHMIDGTIVTKDCPPTGHQDCWTQEYRERVSEIRKNNVVNRDDYTVFTKKIKCTQCGCNFHQQTQYHKDGSSVIYWRCSAPGKTCGTPSLREDLLMQMTAEVLGISEFDEEIFLERICYIEVASATDIVFHFNNGETTTRQWVKPKRKRK